MSDVDKILENDIQYMLRGCDPHDAEARRHKGGDAAMSAHTPGPWRYEAGGGHAYNRIRGSDSVQTNGWPERRGGYSNASYSDMVCENLGDVSLPGPAANVRLIVAAPEMFEALKAIAEGCSFPDDDVQRAIRDRARAAIAKATQS